LEKYRNSLVSEGESVSPMTKASKIFLKLLISEYNYILMMLKTSSKTSWLNVCHILITTVVKFLHENSRQFPLEDHQTTEINNFKNIFDALVVQI
jgi:tRNA G37 N-methylase Trm5